MFYRNKLFQIFITILLITGYQLPANAKVQEILWTGCGISKLGFMKDLAHAYEKKSGIRIKLQGGGATKGLRSVALGSSDLGGSCRLPLVIENKDGTFSVDRAERQVKVIPLGWDALVTIINKNNQLVDSISRQQLRDVLTGKITRWDQLGAVSTQPINLYVRIGKISGVGSTLRQQLFNNVDQDFRKDAIYLPSSGKIEKAVQDDPWGLAVSGVSSSRHQDVKILKLNGISASMENLKSGVYPLYRLLFLVAPQNLQERPEILDFIRFALSTEGQAVTSSAGTLPYHQGVSLIFNGTSAKYLHTIDIMEQNKIYTLSGQ